MPLKFEELEVLRKAEKNADSIWRNVLRWEPFASEVVGRQLARSADSIGANIAESFGRFHYGEKLQFLYYARGSLYETKYWLNRAIKRNLLPQNLGQSYTNELTELAR
jgi:four helix bundle protein